MKTIVYVVVCSLFMLSISNESNAQTTAKKTPTKQTQPKPPAAAVVYPRPITVAAGFQAAIEEPGKIIVPRNLSKGQKYPLVIFLPWTGGDAAQHYNLYASRLSETAPFVAMITPEPASTRDHSWQGFEAAVSRYENRILKDLEDLKKRDIIDPARVILAGFSLGGDMGWALSQRHPELFKGAIISGSRTSWSEKNGLAEIKKYGTKYFFVMGTEESADRLTGLSNTLSLLDKSRIAYRYERTPGSHTSPDFELFAAGLKYILN